MKDKYLSIGEMAKINHTTIPILRRYDKAGLLKPNYVDPDTGYRYYDIKQNARFDMIQYMKELGARHSEIKEVLDSGDINRIEAILIRKREMAQCEIVNLKLQKEAIERTIESIERYRKSPKIGTLTLEYIPHRHIFSMKTDINFYQHGIDTYGLLLKKLKKYLMDHNVPAIYYHNAGTILSKENFMNQNYDSDKMFVFVDNHFEAKEKIEALESSMYACIYLDDFNKEKEYATRLLTFCYDSGYTITGDYICEVVTELNVYCKIKGGHTTDRPSFYIHGKFATN